MSKYKLGDPDYVIPGAGMEALEWEIVTEEVIPALKQRIKELEKVLREIDSDPSQEILTDAQRKILEKGK